MTNSIGNKLKFAQGALGVRMKRSDEEQQPVNLAEIFSSLGVKLPGTDM